MATLKGNWIQIIGYDRSCFWDSEQADVWSNRPEFVSENHLASYNILQEREGDYRPVNMTTFLKLIEETEAACQCYYMQKFHNA